MSLKQVKLRRAEPKPEAGPPCGPGPRLRDARKARGIGQGQAAEQLKLSVAVLESIERDDYSGLPDSIYVRGYLTGYARMLGIASEEILAEYRAFRGESAAPSLAVRSSIKQQARSSDTGVRWVSYALMLAIVAVVGWWGYEQLRLENGGGQAPVALVPETGSEAPTGEAAVAAGPVAPDSVQSVAASSAPEPVAAPALATSVPSAAEPGAAERLAAALSAPESSPDVSADVTLAPPGEPAAQVQPETVSELAVIEPALMDAIVTEPIGTEPIGMEPADAAEQAVIASGDVVGDTPVSGDRLELIFERDCWIEIRDSEGTKLAFGLAKSGSFQEVVGTSPFRILLGDSGAVTLVLNGIVVDPAEFGSADGRPARFSLGGS